MTRKALIAIEPMIHAVRGHRVILSSDRAAIYDVEPRALNQAVKRNQARFPIDFAFRLTELEAARIERSRSQSVILKRGANVKYTPLAFTEHGAVMAATVLNSAKAVQMSIVVVRAFLRLRQWLAGQTALTARLDDLERRVGGHSRDIRAIVTAIRRLVQPAAEGNRRRIGFGAPPAPSKHAARTNQNRRTTPTRAAR
jgi:hypothetical protein